MAQPFLLLAAFATLGGSPDEHVLETTVRPLLREYCLQCHSSEKHKGDLDLERFDSLERVRREPATWQRVIEQLHDREMPPPEKPQPRAEERERIVAFAQSVLDELALAHAGDPGPVVLRRLSNAEYTYSLRDLTGVESLDPAREFPVDGAAGEGFTNVGNALVMSPELLTKYLDAGKHVAEHALLLPDGIRFVPAATRRDQTEELLAAIRAFYRRFTDPSGGDVVNLQGIVFSTNEGGRLPLERYLAATLGTRDAALGLSPKYLATLLETLRSREPSLLLDPLRAAWRAAKPEDATALANEIAAWQKALWKFSSVGHIGKTGGPKAWMEPLNPLTNSQELHVPVPLATDGSVLTLYLSTGDAGDGAEHDVALWQAPRFVVKGRPDLLLRDVRAMTNERIARRARIFGSAAAALAAAAEAESADGPIDIAALAERHAVDPDDLAAWLGYLGIGASTAGAIDTCFAKPLEHASSFDFVHGWGSPETPLLVANSSDSEVRIPGRLKPHSIAVHPSPTLRAVVGWRSPVAGRFRVEAQIQHVHLDCGNGVEWTLELRRGALRRRLASGEAVGGELQRPAAIEDLAVRPGDVVALSIGARGGEHTCDLTAVDLAIGDWDLAADCSPDVLAANPHADRLGHAGVWHFGTEPERANAPAIPAGSLLDQWLAATERAPLAAALQQLLVGPAPAAGPDAELRRQLGALDGPLLASAGSARPVTPSADWGLDSARFESDASLRVQAPALLEIRVPAELVAGGEFVATGTLDPQKGAEGSVQFQVLAEKPMHAPHLLPGVPVVVREGSAAQQRMAAAFDEFRALFPAALCYVQIVPVDEAVTLTQYYRQDGELARLMLDDAEARTLDRLWDELHFVAQDALTQVDAFEQLYQFATQDADPKVFEPLREPIRRAAAEFRQRLVDAEPAQLAGVLEFAGRAWRRPLEAAEAQELRSLYAQLCKLELPHDEALRLLLARVLVAPAFLYHRELPGPGADAQPVSDWELASRLSYFLWSSVPDAELRAAAAAGRLHEDGELLAQTRRMLRDPRVRRIGTEFGCSWLHIHGFDELGEKSERVLPTFNGLRGELYEESVRFLSALFQENAPVLDLLDSDSTFLDEALAAHYAIPGVVGSQWRRVEGVKTYGRGGILGLGATLAQQSGASRTSPILRGNWLCEVLLGDKLPRPPKDVPKLPEEENSDSLTVRQLVEKHSSDPRCARCHERMDAFGFALEGFDAIGRRRTSDLGGRAVDTHAKTMDGAEFDGIDGLRGYLLTKKRDVFLMQFCRKLLGYALGRAVQLSDRPLLQQIVAGLAGEKRRMDDVVAAIVLSRQFREIRGLQMTDPEGGLR